jgi:hypothetical protein
MHKKILKKAKNKSTVRLRTNLDRTKMGHVWNNSFYLLRLYKSNISGGYIFSYVPFFFFYCFHLCSIFALSRLVLRRTVKVIDSKKDFTKFTILSLKINFYHIKNIENERPRERKLTIKCSHLNGQSISF